MLQPKITDLCAVVVPETVWLSELTTTTSLTCHIFSEHGFHISMQKLLEYYLQIISLQKVTYKISGHAQYFISTGITSGELATGPAIIPLTMRPDLGLCLSFTVAWSSSEIIVAFKSSWLSFNFLSPSEVNWLLHIVSVWHFSLLCWCFLDERILSSGFSTWYLQERNRNKNSNSQVIPNEINENSTLAN